MRQRVVQNVRNDHMAGTISPRQLAEAIGISESSLKRWSDDGLLAVERTAGGHRRIPLPEAVRFVRDAGLTVARPDLLGLTGAAGSTRQATARSGAADRLYELLADDRAAESIALVTSLYVDGASIGWICDVPIREALARAGELWEHNPSGVFVEHRATETCGRALAELRRLVPTPPPGAPVALGGAFERDVYHLPSAMVALVLSDAGFIDRDLGPATPVSATVAAVAHHNPEIVWQSFSVPPGSVRAVRAGVDRIVAAMGSASLVIGGRASAALPLASNVAVYRLESMTELAAFARGLVASDQVRTADR